MKVLIVDNGEILHKGEYDAEAVAIIYDWGHRVITRDGGVQEFCTDLEKLLSQPRILPGHLKAVRTWLQEHSSGKR